MIEFSFFWGGVLEGKKIGSMLGKCCTTVSDVISDLNIFIFKFNLCFSSIQVKEFAF